MAGKMLKVIRALADDCREQGDSEMAEGFTTLAGDVEELCAAVIAGREASDRGDTFAALDARLRTTSALLKFVDADALTGEKAHG